VIALYCVLVMRVTAPLTVCHLCGRVGGAEKILSDALALAEEDVDINARLARHGAEVVPKASAPSGGEGGGAVACGICACGSPLQGANILHHCNTGALATVDIGTALGVIYGEAASVCVCADEIDRTPRILARCRSQSATSRARASTCGWMKRGHACRCVRQMPPRHATSPLPDLAVLQGARLTAWELMRGGVPMHLIVDSASGAARVHPCGCVSSGMRHYPSPPLHSRHLDATRQGGCGVVRSRPCGGER